MIKHILILEDSAERISGFEEAVRSLPGEWALKIWRDAPSLIEVSLTFSFRRRISSAIVRPFAYVLPGLSPQVSAPAF